MWCPKCQADVAAEVTADHKRVLCAVCTADIGGVHSSLASEKTKEARELLERWSNSRFTDPYGPLLADRTAKPAAIGERAETGPAHAAPTASPAAPAPAKPSPASPSGPSNPSLPGGGPRIRPRPADAVTAPSAGDDATQRQIESQPALRPSLRVDAGHATAAPHFDIHAAIADKVGPKANWTALAGQLLAYAGVALLTVGTVLVLWGYFGGVEIYKPTGWLILTAGQMMFFLGMVTLVSSGMEQTTEEVTRRIDSLGDKLLRFEQASRDHALRGPSIPPERFVAGAPVPREAVVREQARS